MRNKLLCFLTMVLSVFSQVSCMLAPVQQQAVLVQFWQKDESKGVKCRLDVQSFGRLAATCSYMNKNWQVEDFSKEQFGLVEKCLYFYAPKVSLPIIELNERRLCSIIDAHVQKVDARIMDVYSHIKKTKWAHSFTDKLSLSNNNRIAFYFGKLPGQKPRFTSLSECDSESEHFFDGHNDPLIDDILDAAYEDAKCAILNRDVDRARVVLNRYEQFVNYDNELIEPLCALGKGQLLVDYLSVLERSVEYAADSNGLTAIEIARDIYEDDELVEFLQRTIDVANSQPLN